MIVARRAQLTFGDKLIAEEVDGLYEDWMVHADAVLADDAIVSAAYEALAERHRLSRSRGRPGFCAEVVVRLLVLSTRATGATPYSSGKCAPISSTAGSPASGSPRWPTPRPWANGAWPWDPR